MAKIKGIELKNVKEFRGHEGEELMQGDVYYKNKKVGFYSQDAHGGMDTFDIFYNVDRDIRKEIMEIADNYIGGVLFKKIDDLYDKMYNYTSNHTYEKKGYEYLFMDLLELYDHEKLYKKYSKKYNDNTIYIIYDNVFSRRIGNSIFGKIGAKDKTFFKYNGLADFVIE